MGNSPGIGSRNPHQWRSFALLALLVFCLPSFGPLLDHHFAERYPQHQHIFLGAVVPEHTHPYETPHSHTRDTTDTPPADGTVYLTPIDGISQSATVPTVPITTVSLDFPEPSNSYLHILIDPRYDIPPDAFVPPPKKPPRL